MHRFHFANADREQVARITMAPKVTADLIYLSFIIAVTG
jgi:hypothetical protein